VAGRYDRPCLIWITGTASYTAARALVAALDVHATAFLIDQADEAVWEETVGDRARQWAKLAPIGQQARAWATTVTVVVAEVVPSIAVREEQKRLAWESEIKFIEIWAHGHESPSWYQRPDAADLEVNVDEESLDSCINRILALLGDEQ
jgi:adenylylsulfate kinase-like enzyme